MYEGLMLFRGFLAQNSFGKSPCRGASGDLLPLQFQFLLCQHRGPALCNQQAERRCVPRDWWNRGGPHEVTLAAAVTNLKRIIMACGDRKAIIITPGPRYLSQLCCCTAGHCIHLLVPESGLKMMADLARLHLFIQRRLSSSSNCQVIPACDLGRRAPAWRRLWLLSLPGVPCTAPLHHTRGWPSWTVTLATRRRRPPYSRRPRRSTRSGREPNRPLPMSPDLKPDTLSRPWPASRPPADPPTYAASRGAALTDPDPETSSRVALRGAAAAESERASIRHLLCETCNF
jgi:hypothetical protein